MSWTHQFLTDLKKKLDFVFFPLGLSYFGWGAWFPFDKGQSNHHIFSWQSTSYSVTKIAQQYKMYCFSWFKDCSSHSSSILHSNGTNFMPVHKASPSPNILRVSEIMKEKLNVSLINDYNETRKWYCSYKSTKLERKKCKNKFQSRIFLRSS